MHALPSHPRHPLVAGLLALLLALLGLAATAPDLGTLDFSIGGGTTSSADTFVSPTAEPSATWPTDPLAPPIELLGPQAGGSSAG